MTDFNNLNNIKYGILDPTQQQGSGKKMFRFKAEKKYNFDNLDTLSYSPLQVSQDY